MSAWASDVDVDAPVSRLSIGEQQLVELARVLLEAPKLLILDEPNSALNDRDTERLFAVLRQLRERGVTMLYVSHRLEEVFAISDRVTIARNGKDVTTRDRAGLTIARSYRRNDRRASGRDVSSPAPVPDGPASRKSSSCEASPAGNSETSISPPAPARSWAWPGSKAQASRACSIFCLAPTRRVPATPIYPDGRGLPRSPTEAARRGVCLVPADRRRNGLMLDRSILFNVSQVVIGALNTSPLFSLPGSPEPGFAPDRAAAHQDAFT